ALWARPGMTAERRCSYLALAAPPISSLRRGSAGGRRLGGLFGLRLALLARHGLFRIAARLALGDAGLVEEAHHAIGRLRALLHPGLHLLEVELEALFLVLRQQRIVIAETLDEAAVARRARVGEHDVIERALLGAGARHADDERHLRVPFLRVSDGYKFSVTRTRPLAPTAVSPCRLRKRPRRSMISPLRRDVCFTDTISHSRSMVSSA